MARVVVVGGSVAGLGAALALSRQGHAVTVLEADSQAAPETGSEMWQAWQRPGVPQFRHYHGVLARGRRVLLDGAPDVMQDILAAGVEEQDLAKDVPGGVREPGDEDLVALRLRRPLFEGALRRAVEREPLVHVRVGVTVNGLVAVNDHPSRIAQVVGVSTRDGEVVAADLVVIATGRSAPVVRWVREAGGEAPEEEWEDGGMLYYGRYYRLRPGAALPERQRTPVRGDLGYLGYILGMGDAGTFVLSWLVPNWDADLRILREARSFQAVAESVAALAPWVEAARAEPIWRVESMSHPRNTLRRFVQNGRPVMLALHVIGDALCHTNPALGWGVSLALAQAFTLADVVASHPGDPYAQAQALDARVWEEAETCFRASAGFDRSRIRAWRGEDIGPPTEADWVRFSRAVLFPAATKDPAVFRAVMRAASLLDPLTALRQNEPLIARAKAIASQLAAAEGATPPLPPVPAREELLAVARSAGALAAA